MHHLLHQFGLAGLFLAIFGESFGIPLPGESLLIGAAGLASKGQLPIVAVFVVAAVAACLGDNVGFAIGHFGGPRLVNRLAARLGIAQDRIDHVHERVRRHGAPIVVIARFIPLLRQLNGISAGAAGMDWRYFTAANAVGALLWAGVWSFGTYWFGRFLHVPRWLRHESAQVAALIVGILVVAMILAWLRTRREERVS
ncbi:DedA family protein [Sphingomonas ginkgonis]|uniref:DedA family protein n=1 Tax=Sphingomonas ginkgonis TaxID=2315330 RepID=A0A3R9Z478_9SPHN|nr:DedA family protein [Sphingomonas ginkgonis]RST29399.1 DedA family protein [Sphingomonas ginkgonis]